VSSPGSGRLEIRPAGPEDEADWLRLWRGYCDFYQHSVGKETTAATWERILSSDETFRSVVAVCDERVVGFATLIIHPITWSTAPACYLEDLFVAPEERGRGIAQSLIRHLVDEARTAGWSRLYWMTERRNAAARIVYDKFARADGFVRYVIHFDDG
jgi:GNAT superfamily N-acetyltransferase